MPDEYRMRGGDPRRAVAVPIDLRPPLSVAWQEKYTEPPVLPRIADGRLFLELPGGGIAAYDELTHRRLWHHEAAGFLEAVGAREVYWTTTKRKTHVLDMETGRRITVLSNDVGSNQLLTEGLLVGEKGGVWAESVAQGWRSWHYVPRDERVTTGLCANSETAAATLVDGGVVALRLSDGAERWLVELGDLKWVDINGVRRDGNTSRPCIYDESVLVSVSQDHVLSLDLGSGRRNWSRREAGIATGTSYLCGDRYCVTSAAGKYYELDARTGAIVRIHDFRKTLPRPVGAVGLGQPLLVSATHAFVGSMSGHVMAFDRESGAYNWSIRPKGVGGRVFELAAANGRLYFEDGENVFCLAFERGSSGKPTADDGRAASILELAVISVHLRQAVTSHAPYFKRGGDFTVLDCSVGGARLFVAFRAEKKDKGSVAWGDGYLWVPACEDADGLLGSIRKALGVSGGRAVKKAARVKAPVHLGVAVLQVGVDAIGAGRGSWTRSKWSADNGSPEFFVRWSLKEKRVLLAEKDEAYRPDLVELVASLATRP